MVAVSLSGYPLSMRTLGQSLSAMYSPTPTSAKLGHTLVYSEPMPYTMPSAFEIFSSTCGWTCGNTSCAV